jgi:hypothetical protein
MSDRAAQSNDCEVIVIVFSGNIHRAGVHDCIMSEKHFNERLKVRRVQISAFQLPILARPAAA